MWLLSLGTADALFRCGGKINDLLIAWSLSNVLPKIVKSDSACSRYSWKCRGSFLGHGARSDLFLVRLALNPLMLLDHPVESCHIRACRDRYRGRRWWWCGRTKEARERVRRWSQCAKSSTPPRHQWCSLLSASAACWRNGSPLTTYLSKPTTDASRRPLPPIGGRILQISTDGRACPYFRRIHLSPPERAMFHPSSAHVRSRCGAGGGAGSTINTDVESRARNARSPSSKIGNKSLAPWNDRWVTHSARRPFNQTALRVRQLHRTNISTGAHALKIAYVTP